MKRYCCLFLNSCLRSVPDRLSLEAQYNYITREWKTLLYFKTRWGRNKKKKKRLKFQWTCVSVINFLSVFCWNFYIDCVLLTEVIFQSSSSSSSSSLNLFFILWTIFTPEATDKWNLSSYTSYYRYIFVLWSVLTLYKKNLGSRLS